MKRLQADNDTPGDWVTLPGGELETRRPLRLCQNCRAKCASPFARVSPLCFQCYKEEARREQVLQAARDLDTASKTRFQGLLPFEPVDKSRLERLRALRASARTADRTGLGAWVDKRRQAQIAARRALEQIFGGVSVRRTVQDERAIVQAVHAAELQLPESWLPFVMSR